jgi:hypothetical protein
MIISNQDNFNFNNNYGSIIGLTSSYIDKSISGINTFGVYNYQEISLWSEPDFYKKYFIGRKINLINTEFNNKIVTVKNNSLNDKVYYNTWIDSQSLGIGNGLFVELILKTDRPLIYSGGLDIKNDRIIFNDLAPAILKPGVQFSIDGSANNQNFITVANIPLFINNLPDTYYATQ